MWSVGCITSTALSGTFVFPRTGGSQQDSYQAAVNAAAKCDLSFLDDDNNLSWREIRFTPKDFIKKLLVLQENRRMTAAEALVHPWFANQVYAAEFTALDEKTNRSWRPRLPDTELVESIQSKDKNSGN